MKIEGGLGQLAPKTCVALKLETETDQQQAANQGCYERPQGQF